MKIETTTIAVTGVALALGVGLGMVIQILVSQPFKPASKIPDIPASWRTNALVIGPSNGFDLIGMASKGSAVDSVPQKEPATISIWAETVSYKRYVLEIASNELPVYVVLRTNGFAATRFYAETNTPREEP